MRIGSRRKGLWALLGILGVVAAGCSSGGGSGDDPGGGPPPPTTWKISGSVTGGGANPVALTLAPGGATTSSDAATGAYAFSGLSNGAYTVTPSKVGFTFTPASQTVTVSGADRALSFTASPVAGPVYTLSGTITDGLVGIADVSVSLSGDSSGTALTGPDGSFAFASLPAGSYHLVPSKPGTVFAPTFADETIVAADVVSDFVGSAAPTYAIAGAVTGPWVEGVTVTLSNADGVVGTATTSAGGTYGFTGIGAGDYTVTPSLAGYGYAPVDRAVTVTSADRLGEDFSATSSVSGYRISGTLTYAGSRSGQVYVAALSSGCYGCTPVGGTSFPSTRAAPWTYELRGVPNGAYMVTAYVDTLGYGLRNASLPSGTSATVDVNSADVTGVDVTLAHPATPTFTKPRIFAQGGDRAAVVLWSRDDAAGGAELASGYRLSWGTTDATSDGSIDLAAHLGPIFLHGGAGVTNGSVWFYRVVPYFIDASGTKILGSVPSDPVEVTIGPVADGVGSSTVNVRADFPGVTPGPGANLYVLLLHESPTDFAVRVARAATATTGTTIAMTGVSDGTWEGMVMLDQDGDGDGWGPGDVAMELPGSLTAPTASPIVASVAPASAQPRVATHFSRDVAQDSYAISNHVRSGSRQVVSAVLWSGEGVALPHDLGTAWREFSTARSYLGSTAPQPGEVYVYRVTYADGTSEDLTATIDTVFGPAQLATGLTERTTGTSGATTLSRQVPEFNWTAPSTVANPTYSVWLQEVGGVFNWGSDKVRGTSVLFDDPAPLQTGVEYEWLLTVEDAAGNSAEARKRYTP